MTETIEIRPTGPIRATLRPPGSKSLTNRALVCAALAEGESTLLGALDSEDTRVMIEALRVLGIPVAHDRQARSIHVTGCRGHLPSQEASLYTANSGTTLRFLTAMVALGHGQYRLDGSPRMRERPVQDLIDALRPLGAEAICELDNGCPPVVVHAAGLAGGRTSIAGDISSQFLSGLLMASPYSARPVELLVSGPLVSKPYIEMTLSVMRAFGARVEVQGLERFLIPAGQVYQGRCYEVEPDASAASYFFAAAAVTGGQVTIEGLSRESLQGDVAFCDCLAQMGCDVQYGDREITVVGRPLHGITVDMNPISDTVQTLAAVALFADGPTAITGVAHIRHKETDRLAAVATELRKLGADVEEQTDGLRIVPRRRQGAEIDTYDDHRMAMSMAVVGLAQPGVVIRDPKCTAKTYPAFFEDLARLSAPS